MRWTLVVLAMCALLALQAAPAGATTRDRIGAAPFRVVVADSLRPSELRRLSSLGAAGLLVPGVGPTVNRRRALAALVRGAQANARLGGVPGGAPLLSVSRSSGIPDSLANTIVLTLPPRGAPRANDRRYPVFVIGPGFHGLLRSTTTRIDGLVSIVDIAPTALRRARGSMTSAESRHPLAVIAGLDRKIHANNRLKLPALIILGCLVGLFALIRSSAAMTALISSLLVSGALGAAGITSEPLIVALFTVGTAAGALALARVFDTENRLLALIVAVLVLHLLLFAAEPAWVALTPLGPTQNSRFWGMGNQLETLLLAPLLAGAALAYRRFGALGFAAFSALGMVLVTDNRFGSDGGGAIVFGVALAFLGSRALRLGRHGFVTLLLLASGLVLGIVSYNLHTPGPDHLRSAFDHGFGGMLAVVENRVPLAYAPAVRDWPLVLPLGLWFVLASALAFRHVRGRLSRDIVLALGLAIGTSLLVNDSAAYELTGGVAALAAVVRVQPARIARFSTSVAPVPLGSRPATSDLRSD